MTSGLVLLVAEGLGVVHAPAGRMNRSPGSSVDDDTESVVLRLLPPLRLVSALCCSPTILSETEAAEACWKNGIDEVGDAEAGLASTWPANSGEEVARRHVKPCPCRRGHDFETRVGLKLSFGLGWSARPLASSWCWCPAMPPPNLNCAAV